MLQTRQILDPTSEEAVAMIAATQTASITLLTHFNAEPHTDQRFRGFPTALVSFQMLGASFQPLNFGDASSYRARLTFAHNMYPVTLDGIWIVDGTSAILQEVRLCYERATIRFGGSEATARPLSESLKCAAPSVELPDKRPSLVPTLPAAAINVDAGPESPRSVL